MENNQVTLSLKDYNELRDFKTEIEKKHTLNVYSERWLSTDEAIKEIADTNKGVAERIKRLQGKIYELEHPELKKVTLNQVGKMSIWQYIKWRKGGLTE